MTFGHTWLYVVEHEHGYYKIGHSNSPQRRVSQLQVGSPYEVCLWLMAKFLNDQINESAPDVEEELHNQFNSGLVRGEWFEADRNEIYQYLACEAKEDTSKISYLVNYPREAKKKEEMNNTRFGTYYGPLSQGKSDI